MCHVFYFKVKDLVKSNVKVKREYNVSSGIIFVSYYCHNTRATNLMSMDEYDFLMNRGHPTTITLIINVFGDFLR